MAGQTLWISSQLACLSRTRPKNKEFDASLPQAVSIHYGRIKSNLSYFCNWKTWDLFSFFFFFFYLFHKTVSLWKINFDNKFKEMHESTCSWTLSWTTSGIQSQISFLRLCKMEEKKKMKGKKIRVIEKKIFFSLCCLVY